MPGLSDLHRILQDFSIKQQESFFLFIQANYLHERILKPDMLNHIRHLAEELIRINDIGKISLEKQITGNARFLHQLKAATKALGPLIDQFLFWEHLKSKPAFQLERIRFIKGDASKAQKLAEKLMGKINAKALKNESDYTVAGELAEHLYFNLNDSKFASFPILEQALNHYTHSYLARLLRIQLEIKAHNHIFEQSPDILALFIELPKAYIDTCQHPTLLLYHSMLNLWDQPQYAVFDDCINQYFDCFDQISTDDSSLIGNHLITLLNNAYERTGDLIYLQQMFRLFEFFRSRLELFWDYFKEPLFFTNALAVAAKVKEYAWAKDFLEAMQENFSSPEDSNALMLGKARMELFGGNYDLAEDYLYTISTYAKQSLVIVMVHLCYGILYLNRLHQLMLSLDKTDFTDEAKKRKIQIERTLLENKLNAFYQALNRDDVLKDSRTQSYFNFISVARAIKQLLIRENWTQEEVEQLLKQVEALVPLASKGTLLEFIKTRLL